MTTLPQSVPVQVKHVPALDGWRGMAILLLLVGHFLPLAGINLGRVGVSLFFVLSGMLMARLLFVDQVGIALFYRRRLARILPAHVVFILLTALAWTWLQWPLALGELLPPLFFYNNYVLKDTLQFGHIWSLSVEEHSYVVLSLVAVWARARTSSPRLALAALAALSAMCAVFIVAYHAAHPPGPERYGLMLHTEAAGYGIALSALLCSFMARRAIPATGPLLVPALLAVGVVLHWWKVPGAVAQVLGVGCFALAVNLLPNSAALVQRCFAVGWLRQCGLWSFSLYLWQQPFYAAHLKHGLALPLAIAGAVAAGVLSYYLVEGPARRYLNRL